MLYPTDDEATVIDRDPHWSIPALPRQGQPSAVPPPAPYMLPRTFYSYAEEQSALAVDTEHVTPLPPPAELVGPARSVPLAPPRRALPASHHASASGSESGTLPQLASASEIHSRRPLTSASGTLPQLASGTLPSLASASEIHSRRPLTSASDSPYLASAHGIATATAAPSSDDSAAFGSIRPDWQLWLSARWARYAVPFCGITAGLILALGYLALGGERRAVAASASQANAAPIVMRVDAPAPTGRRAAIADAIALARQGVRAADRAEVAEVVMHGSITPTDTALALAAPVATTPATAAPALSAPSAAAPADTAAALPARADAAPGDAVGDADADADADVDTSEAAEIEMAPATMLRRSSHTPRVHAPSKRIASKHVGAKRGPITLNAKTALGDLRPTRMR